eukprot:scaffold47906_cov35-Phaeocystis_antarctica.AAC.1
MYDDRVIAHLHGPVARNYVRVEHERQPPLDGAQISPWGRVERAAGVVEKTPGCLARGTILVGHHQVHPEVGKHALHGQPVSPMNSCESQMLLCRKRREAWGHAIGSEARLCGHVPLLHCACLWLLTRPWRENSVVVFESIGHRDRNAGLLSPRINP